MSKTIIMVIFLLTVFGCEEKNKDAGNASTEIDVAIDENIDNSNTQMEESKADIDIKLRWELANFLIEKGESCIKDKLFELNAIDPEKVTVFLKVICGHNFEYDTNFVYEEFLKDGIFSDYLKSQSFNDFLIWKSDFSEGEIAETKEQILKSFKDIGLWKKEYFISHLGIGKSYFGVSDDGFFSISFMSSDNYCAKMNIDEENRIVIFDIIGIVTNLKQQGLGPANEELYDNGLSFSGRLGIIDSNFLVLKPVNKKVNVSFDDIKLNIKGYPSSADISVRYNVFGDFDTEKFLELFR